MLFLVRLKRWTSKFILFAAGTADERDPDRGRRTGPDPATTRDLDAIPEGAEAKPATGRSAEPGKTLVFLLG